MYMLGNLTLAQIIQHSGVSVRILSGKQGKQRYLLTNSTVLHKVPFGSTGRCVNKEQDLWPPLADALSFSFGIPSRRAKARPLQKFNVPLLGFIGFKTQKTTSLALENHCGRWVLNGTQTLLLCVKVTSEASFSILNSAPQWNCLLGMYITPPLLSSSESFHIKPLRLAGCRVHMWMCQMWQNIDNKVAKNMCGAKCSKLFSEKLLPSFSGLLLFRLFTKVCHDHTSLPPSLVGIRTGSSLWNPVYTAGRSTEWII